jgi:hypothetical protein
MPVTMTNKSPNSTAPASSNLDLLDLLGGLDLGGPPPTTAAPMAVGSSSASLVNNNLANLFSAQSPTPVQVPSSTSSSSNFLIDGFLGTPTPPSKKRFNNFSSF